MKTIKTTSLGIKIILVILILANVVCGDPTPVSKILTQGICNAIFCMFLLFNIAAVTQIYELNKQKKIASKS